MHQIYISAEAAEEFDSRADIRTDVIYIDQWFASEYADEPHVVDVFYTPDGEGKVFVPDDEAYYLTPEEQLARLKEETGIEEVIVRIICRRKGLVVTD